MNVLIKNDQPLKNIKFAIKSAMGTEFWSQLVHGNKSLNTEVKSLGGKINTYFFAAETKYSNNVLITCVY